MNANSKVAMLLLEFELSHGMAISGRTIGGVSPIGNGGIRQAQKQSKTFPKPLRKYPHPSESSPMQVFSLNLLKKHDFLRPENFPKFTGCEI